MATQTWNIDTTHSSIDFSVRHLVVAKVRGQFTKWTGKLELDLDNLAASRVEVEIDAASVDTREPKRDDHLRSADFLDVAEHPKLSFRSTGVEVVKADKMRVLGDLTIHGVTRPVALDTEFNGRTKDPWGGERVGFSAKTKVDRKDFGLQWNMVLEAGGFVVGDAIEITLDVEATRAA
jgi:polyisoprenoid-binding protein YceI